MGYGVLPHELGEFLRARRASLPARGDRRRVPGWRREEVAIAANVSVDYLIRLEQGRATHPSPQVIDSLASALQLDAHERAYLHRLAGTTDEEQPQPPVHDQLPPELADLLETIRTPAFIMDEALDIVAWNDLACQVITDFAAHQRRGRVNLALLTFLDSDFIASYVDWPAKADTVAAMLQFRLPALPKLAPLVDELLESSAEFRRRWETWLVADKQRGSAALYRPGRTILETSFQLLPIAGTRFEMAVYTTPHGSPSRDYVDSLA